MAEKGVEEQVLAMERLLSIVNSKPHISRTTPPSLR